MPTCGNYGKCEEPRLLPGLAGCRDRAGGAAGGGCNRRACAAV